MKTRAALPALAVLAVLAAGCSGGGDKPKALPTLSPTPSATATVAPVPSAARAQTPQGAAAFARFYYDQLNVAFRTSDADIVRAYSDSACGTCAIYVQGLTESKRRGWRIVGTPFLVTDVEATPPMAGAASVEVFGSLPGTQRLDGAGKVIEAVGAQGRFHFTLRLKVAGETWTVDDIKIDKD